MPIERLSPEDAIMLWPERIWPQHIAALAILYGGSLVDADGKVRIEAVRQAVAGRLHLVPRFRQLLYRPERRLGPPFWADAPAIDLTEHIDLMAVPPPGGETVFSPSSTCGKAPSTSHGRSGACGFSTGCRKDALACSSRCTMSSPMALRVSAPSPHFSIWRLTRSPRLGSPGTQRPGLRRSSCWWISAGAVVLAGARHLQLSSTRCVAPASLWPPCRRCASSSPKNRFLPPASTSSLDQTDGWRSSALLSTR